MIVEFIVQVAGNRSMVVVRMGVRVTATASTAGMVFIIIATPTALSFAVAGVT